VYDVSVLFGSPVKCGSAYSMLYYGAIRLALELRVRVRVLFAFVDWYLISVILGMNWNSTIISAEIRVAIS